MESLGSESLLNEGGKMLVDFWGRGELEILHELW
jgi:hypothetical protein